MGIRDRIRKARAKALSKGIDVLAKRLYGKSHTWDEDERAAGIILSGDSRTAGAQASELASRVGYEVPTFDDPSLDITRPRAGRTFGARFDHYPILSPRGALPAKGSLSAWDLTLDLVPPIVEGLRDFKETLILAFTALGSPESERLEDQLLELHPVLEPQTIVVFARLGNLEQERCYRRVTMDGLTLTLPHIPTTLVMNVSPSGELTYRCLALGPLNRDAPRFGILSLLGGESWIPDGFSGVMEYQRGKTKHRSTAEKRFARPFQVTIPLDSSSASSSAVPSNREGDAERSGSEAGRRS